MHNKGSTISAVFVAFFLVFVLLGTAWAKGATSMDNPFEQMQAILADQNIGATTGAGTFGINAIIDPADLAKGIQTGNDTVLMNRAKFILIDVDGQAFTPSGIFEAINTETAALYGILDQEAGAGEASTLKAAIEAIETKMASIRAGTAEGFMDNSAGLNYVVVRIDIRGLGNAKITVADLDGLADTLAVNIRAGIRTGIATDNAIAILINIFPAALDLKRLALVIGTDDGIFTRAKMPTQGILSTYQTVEATGAGEKVQCAAFIVSYQTEAGAANSEKIYG